MNQLLQFCYSERPNLLWAGIHLIKVKVSDWLAAKAALFFVTTNTIVEPARTLERNAKIAPFAITCGIYGWMVHTRFLGVEPEAQEAFDAMEKELSKIIESIPLKTDPEVQAKSEALCDSLAAFVEKFPT